MNKQQYIEAFESVYEYDDIDTKCYDSYAVNSAIEESIEDCTFDERIPTQQEMADVVERALHLAEYGDTSDVNDQLAASEDFWNRFPEGR